MAEKLLTFKKFTELIKSDNKKNNIVKLTIKDKKIVSQLEKKLDIFKDMPNLRTLIIHQDGNDNIKTLPPTIFARLNNLTQLDFKSLWLNALPETIFQDLTELTTLSIEYNEFTSLPASLFKNNKKLKKLIIKNYTHTLETLPENIFQGLDQLEELNLDANFLTSLPAGIFQGLPKLKKLDLNRNEFKTLPAGIFYGLTNAKIEPESIKELVEEDIYDEPPPSKLQKRIKREMEDRTKVLKETVWEPQNVYNTGDSDDPWWNIDEIDENDETRFKTTKRGPRKRMVKEKAEYSMKQAEYESVNPMSVTVDNEESDRGEMLNEDAIFEDISLQEFFEQDMDGFLFRLVQGGKIKDILVSSTLYQPSTLDYLRDSTDLILYKCNEPGYMNLDKINLKKPLIDIGKAIGIPGSRIYVDKTSFIKTLLEDTRKYKCYILYTYPKSDKYKTLASYKAIYDTKDTQRYVSNLHCNEGDDMNGVIWTVKPIGDALNSKSKSKSRPSKSLPSKSKSRRSRIYVLNRTRRHSTLRNSNSNDINVGGSRKPKQKKKTRKYYKK
jgi:Leucine-rich repeat (LRR) protein